MQALNEVRSLLERVERWGRAVDDLEVLYDLVNEAEDPALERELEETLARLERELDDYELTQLLNGPYDNDPAIVTISAGAGGTDASDWALMLLRMYTRWA